MIKITPQEIRRGKVVLTLPQDDKAWARYRARLMRTQSELFEYPKHDKTRTT